RDKLVTGVQTCALPISTEQSITVIRENYEVNTLGLHLLLYTAHGMGIKRGVHTSTMSVHYRERFWYPAEELVPLDTPSAYGLTRSEERRVGKECRVQLW